MKKIKIIASITAISCLILSMNNAIAQTPTPVTKGSSHTYTATPLPEGSDYTYTWSVDGGSNSSFGTGAKTNAILWDGAAGVHTITVYPTDNKTGCKGNNFKFQVNILDNLGIKWESTSATLCPITDNQTGGSFDLIADFTGIDGDWSFKYTIDGGSEQSVSVLAASGKTSKITIASVTNPSNTDKITHTYKITEVTSPDGVISKYDALDTNPDHTFTVTINATPGISGITQGN